VNPLTLFRWTDFNDIIIVSVETGVKTNKTLGYFKLIASECEGLGFKMIVFLFLDNLELKPYRFY